MNSRGKPLTPFENFKARFRAGHQRTPHRADEFAHKIDGPWSDLLWPFHGGDNIVDDEFMRYIDFITEICELREGRLGSGKPRRRAHATIFGAEQSRGGRAPRLPLQRLRRLDRTRRTSAPRSTSSSPPPCPATPAYDTDKVVLFGSTSLEPLRAVLPSRSTARAAATGFHPAAEPPALRGAAAPDRADRRTSRAGSDPSEPARCVRRRGPAREHARAAQGRRALIINGDLDAVSTLSSNQVQDERLSKVPRRTPRPRRTLFRLEDHPILRGTLSCFELTPTPSATGATRSRTPSPTRPVGCLTGALLATGDYQRRRPNTQGWQFGTASPRTRQCGATCSRSATATTSAHPRGPRRVSRRPSARASPSTSTSQTVMTSWLAEREQRTATSTGGTTS